MHCLLAGGKLGYYSQLGDKYGDCDPPEDMLGSTLERIQAAERLEKYHKIVDSCRMSCNCRLGQSHGRRFGFHLNRMI